MHSKQNARSGKKWTRPQLKSIFQLPCFICNLIQILDEHNILLRLASTRKHWFHLTSLLQINSFNLLSSRNCQSNLLLHSVIYKNIQLRNHTLFYKLLCFTQDHTISFTFVKNHSKRYLMSILKDLRCLQYLKDN